MMHKKTIACALWLALGMTGCCPVLPPQPVAPPPRVEAPPPPVPPRPNFDYPAARRGEVVDNYHGTTVADPYRWLEDPDSPETRQWVAAQNELTRSFVETPVRQQLQRRLTELWNFPKYGLPEKKGGRYFFKKNDGLQNQPVLYVQENWEAPARALIDPNGLSEDGTVALTGWEASENGKYLAYMLSRDGSDWQELRIRQVDTGEDLPERLQRCKFTRVAWKHDHSGFFYDRHPDEGTVPPQDANSYNRLYFHKLGTPQSADQLVFERPEHKEWGIASQITDDGKYLIVRINVGTDRRSRIYYRRVKSNKPFVPLIDTFSARYTFLGNIGRTFYFLTDLDAPRGRIIAVNLKKADPQHYRTVIEEQEDVLHFAAMRKGHFVVSHMHHARHVLKLFDLKGKLVRELPLPSIGSVYGQTGSMSDREFFFRFASFLHADAVLKYDFDTDQVIPFQVPELDFPAAEFEINQVFFESKDGTKVPMFITHKKGIPLDGSHPTLVEGYGGFSISRTPNFRLSRLPWLENGGVFVLVNLRGGLEYGEQWHRAGMLGNKQNVFDDFIAAAEWLVANRYTSASRLAIIGGSNGGLLTAACMLQRPDLYGAVISLVPVIDMLRYHKFTLGRYWVPEYGNAEADPEHFKFLYAYSPLHNVTSGVTHPPTLIMTADTDDRVVPLHGKKFAATVQAADTGEHPILLRVETKAGHGRGKPTAKRIEEAADIYAFLFKVFGMTVADPNEN